MAVTPKEPVSIAILRELLDCAIGEDLELPEGTLQALWEAVQATLSGPAAEAHDRRVFAERAAQAARTGRRPS